MKKKLLIKRIWHDYRNWEGFMNGMYDEKKDEDKQARIEMSYCLLKSPMSLISAMYCVIDDWKIEAEQYMSHISSNRQAWLGQAACNWNHGATESETRKAWNMLTEQEMIEANDVADGIIQEWERRYENIFRENNFSSSARKDTFYL